MSIIYVPRLIETAEQAERLPVGTIALLDPDKPAAFENHAAVRVDHYEADGFPWLVDSQGLAEHPSMAGWTALVPIEAEEEYSTEHAGLARDNEAIYSSPEDVRRDGWTDPLQRRLVTPWGSA